MERFNKGIIRLRCASNDSRFREGDLLVLHRGDPRHPDALHIELQYDGETELEASLIRGNHVLLTVEPEGWLADQDPFKFSRLSIRAGYRSPFAARTLDHPAAAARCAHP